MKKRLLALFLAFVMAMSLLPVSVFADGETGGQLQGTEDNPITANSNGVTVNKYVSQGGDSQYNLTLEAYASDQLTTTTTTTPLDIVLVLDTSGSMKYKLEGTHYEAIEGKNEWSFNDVKNYDGELYYKNGDEYYLVKEEYTWRDNNYTLLFHAGFLDWRTLGSPSGNPDAVLYTGELYQQVSGTSKIKAMQAAVNNFINSVQTNSLKDQEVYHQIGIVEFASNGYIKKGLTNVETEADSLKTTVNSFVASGATAVDYALNKASDVLDSARSNAQKVVVLFTDGEPNHGNGFDRQVAAAAINKAQTLKASGVTIYTIGVFADAKPDDTTGDFNKYMNAVSSRYPQATAVGSNGYHDRKLTVTWGEDAGKQYYFAADSAASLDQVFSDIADEVTTGTLTANPDADSVLSDKLSGYFAFPAGMSNDEVEVKYAPATEYDAGSRTFTFGAAGALPVGADNPTVEINGDTITIKGFDYKDYAATYDSAENTVSGGKLVVTFPIVAKQSCTAWQAGEHNYETNDAASLTYKMKGGGKGSTNLVDTSNPDEVLSPTAPVTAYTVTYNPDNGTSAVTDSRAYISGQTATAMAAPVYEDHTFNGWKTGNTTYEANETFVVTGNVALTAQWTENVVPTPDPNWDVSRSKTAENLVKQNDGSYTSEVTLSLPSAQEQLVSDVVFVLDKSTSTKVEAEMMSMLNALNQQVKGEGAVVNVGVVIFNKEAHRVLELTQLNDANMSSIRAAIETEISSGTNTHAGLLAGKAMLDGDSSVEANRKYLVFVSDGITYMYNEEPTVTAWSFFADAWNTWAGPDNWNSKYGSNVAPEDWDAWMTDIENKVASQGTTYEYLYGGTATQATPQNNWQTAYANSIDKALYLTYQTYQDVEKAGYNCYAMQATSNASYDWASSFMDYLSDGKQVSFDAIQNDIYYLLSAGSKVVDVIGNDFDFVNDASNLTMKVGNTPLDAVLIKARDGATATYAFDAANSSKDGQDYPYVVSYYQNGKDGSGECFVWEINVDVSNFAPVQLIYKVKLVDAPTDPGTYELPTNESATLYPKDSNGLPGKKQEFEKPTVSYTDEEEDGGGTPGTTNNYTLHYVTNGGNHLSPETKSYKWTKDYEDLPTPVRDGYTFEGWYWDLRLTKPVTGDVDVNKITVTLYAKWSEKIGPDDTGVSNWLETDDHKAYLTGYPDSTFRADRNMTRAEVAQMFYALLLDKNVTITKSFSDVPDDAWYATAVKTLASLGMMDGYPDGTFRPDEPITRAEFATVGLAFAYDPLDASCSYYDVGANAWYHTYVAQATTYGWIGGYPDNTFRPGNNITRVEVCVIVNNMLGRDADERYIDRHEDELVHFVDLSDSYWGYYTIMESTNTHEYTGSFTNEKWTDVK